MQLGARTPTPPTLMPPIFEPGGYLTLVESTPVITSDQAGKGLIYYAQDKHNYLPFLRNGTIDAVPFDEPRLALTSAHSANAIFDVCQHLFGSQLKLPHVFFLT